MSDHTPKPRNFYEVIRAYMAGARRYTALRGYKVRKFWASSTKQAQSKFPGWQVRRGW